MGLFGRTKPLNTFEMAYLEKELSNFKKLHYVISLEGEVCSLDPEFNVNGNLRKNVARLKKDFNYEIYQEACNCNFKQKARLNKSGAPRVHKKYVKDWVTG